MFTYDRIVWALRQIKMRLLESILIILGIALGVAVLSGVVGLMQGFEREAASQSNSPTYRLLTLMPAQNHYGQADMSKPLKRIGLANEEEFVLTYDKFREVRDAKIEGIKYVWISEERRQMLPGAQPFDVEMEKDAEARRKWEAENMIRYILTSSEMIDALGLKIIQGDSFRESDILNKHYTTIVGDVLAKQLFGEKNPIGQTVTMPPGREFTVIGVMHYDGDVSELSYFPGIGELSKINETMLVPYFSYELHPNSSDEGREVRQIYLLADEDAEAAEVYKQVKEFAEQQFGERVYVQSRYLYQLESRESFRAFGIAIGILACAALLIASINILNLMMARVLRRYREIGISRALGASQSDVFKLYLAEAQVLGLIGSILGLGMAMGILKLLSSLTHSDLSLTQLTAIVGFGAALITSLISGFYPALQAASIRPVEALKMD